MDVLYIQDTEGKFIELRVDEKIIKLGDRVELGPDYDGGSGPAYTCGKVECIHGDGFVTLQWASGWNQCLRFGYDGKFDLVVVPAEGEKPKAPDSIKWVGHRWTLDTDDGDLNLKKDGGLFMWLRKPDGGATSLGMAQDIKFSLDI